VWCDGQITAEEFRLKAAVHFRCSPVSIENTTPTKIVKTSLRASLLWIVKSKVRWFTYKGSTVIGSFCLKVRMNWVHKAKPLKHHGIMKTKTFINPNILYCKFSYNMKVPSAHLHNCCCATKPCITKYLNLYSSNSSRRRSKYQDWHIKRKAFSDLASIKARQTTVSPASLQQNSWTPVAVLMF